MFLETLLVLTAGFAAAYPPTYGSRASAGNAPQDSCNLLAQKYPDSTFFPNSTRYDFENTYYWSTAAYLGPACIFCPSKPEMVSDAVTLFSQNQVPFAVRGGGYMALANAANIGPEGILIANTNFTTLSISNDRSSVKIGAGIKWPAVYSYLDEFKVAVNGIRIGDVGVVGFLIGGGIGFHSYEYGMASTYINYFDCVLANGTAVHASQTENDDLFWALRGGGNSFCIVTEVELRTIQPKTIYLGNVGYGSGPEVQEKYVKGMVDFARLGSDDPGSSLEGQTRWVPSRSDNITYHAFLFHNGDSPKAPGLVNLTAPVLPFASGNFTEKSMKTWFEEFPSNTDRGNRKRFIWKAIPAEVEAYRIAIDTYYSEIKELAAVNRFFTAFSVMPITDRVISESAANGGNPLGLNEESAPAMWLVESPSWLDAVDDATVDKVHAKANAKITANLEAAGFSELPFVYLSDADKRQPVFAGYGQENWDRLKEIRAKYDPEMVYTKLLPGGAKVETGVAAKA